MRIKEKLAKIGSRGDTIIEILLSIAVLSLVLSVSYGLANRSSQATRQAQERGEAQKVAEEQLEFLRGYITEDTLPWDDTCFDASGDPTSNAEECKRGTEGRYVIRDIVQRNENTFIVQMEWDNVKGGKDELTLSYKVPLTGDILATENFECSDGVDNDGLGNGPDDLVDDEDPDCYTPSGDYDPTIDDEDPLRQCQNEEDDDGDGFIDYPADPGCDGPFDDEEWKDSDNDGVQDEDDLCAGTDPGVEVGANGCPVLAINGIDYTSCQPSGRSDYCRQDGNSVYSLSSAHPANGNPAFTTKYKFNGLPAATYDLVIGYYNYSYAGQYPAANYRFNVTVSYPGGSQTVQLPIEDNSQSQNIRGSQPISLKITSPNPVITIKWNNDFCSCYGDPNSNGVDHDSNFGIGFVRLRGN